MYNIFLRFVCTLYTILLLYSYYLHRKKTRIPITIDSIEGYH